MKRVFDIIFALVILVLSSFLLTICAIFVFFFISKKIIFVQRRIGYKNKEFSIYKFRSMTNDKDRTGKLLPDNMRLNRFGSFIRSLSLDELPQLINIIKGDMSFVGPRPLLPEYLSLYTEEQIRRHEVKPGITGWAQVNGRNSISWERKLELDVWYMENQSFALDMKIIFMTIV